MVSIFKTSVKNKTEINRLKSNLDLIIPNSKWNFDLEDCDNILRIDFKENVSQVVVNILKEHNFLCVELL